MICRNTKLEDYITEKYISQPRTPKQFVDWFEEKLSVTKQFRHGLLRQNILHEGVAKYFYEELFPLYRLLQNKLEEWNDVKFTPILGNQNFDVRVESSRNNFLKHIEITQADMNCDEKNRMKYLFQSGSDGSVSMIGKVSVKGTDKKGKIISVENAARKHSELNSEKKEQIRDAIKKKQKVEKTPDDTALLVYFDDYTAFANNEDIREMEEFLDSVNNLWNNQYTSLFIVGASGKGFWERRREEEKKEIDFA